MEQTRMKRWNLFGYLFSIIVTFALIGLIIYGKDHKGQLEVVMNVLTVILVVAFFAIIRRNVKQICKNKIKQAMLNTKLKKYLYYIPILLIVVLVVCGLVLRDNEKLSYINTFLLLISIFVAIVYVIVIRIKSKNNKLNKNTR